MSRRTVAKSKNHEIGSLVVRNIKKIVRLTAESWAWTSGSRKAITALFLVFIAWTNQKASHVPKLLSQVWHEDNLSSCERYKIKTSKALGTMHVSLLDRWTGTIDLRQLGLTVVVLISGAFVQSRLITNGVTNIGVMHLPIAVPTITCFRLTLRVIHKLKRTSKGQFQLRGMVYALHLWTRG